MAKLSKIFAKDSLSWKIIGDIAAIVAGAVVFAASLNMFLLPGQIVVGGITGIATLINIYFGIPVGILIFALNVPLVLLNTRFFGRKFLLRTLVGIAATSIACDVCLFFPVTITDPFLCSLFGGATMGAGLGILLSRGYTTGGTDLAAYLLRLIFKRANIGTLIMICDLVIISTSALITKNFTGVFYSALSVWLMGRITDYMISGSQQADMAFIISKDPTGLVSLIYERLDRGATIIDAHGTFTNTPRPMVMCVVGKGELFHLKQLAAEHDPESFMTICRATEVLGEGFAGELK